MMYGVLLPVASLATTLAGAALLILAVLVAAFSVHSFRRARSREAFAPSQKAEDVQAVSEMRALGDRIETLVSQQQLQGETQRQRLGQQINEVRQVVSQQGHRVDGLRGELHHEMQKRDHEIDEIRQQLSAIQRSAALPAPETQALPAPDTRALPPAAPPALPPLGPTEAGGDSFAGAEALPPAVVRPSAPAPEAAGPEGTEPKPPTPEPTPLHDPFGDTPTFEATSALDDFFRQTPEPAPPPSVPEAEAAAPAAPAPIEAQPEIDEPATPEPATPEPQASEADTPFFESSVFSDVGFNAFAPGEPSDATASWTVAPTPSPTPPTAPEPTAAQPSPTVAPTPADPPDGGAWVTAQRDASAASVFAADEWARPAASSAEPAEVEPAEPTPADAPAPYTPPADADDFRFISTVTEDVQRALYLAGVTKLEEIAHWSRSDARRISAQVGVSEETIMNQWVFEAQGALFERYSSHVGG